MAIPHGRLRFMWGLAAAGKLSCIDSYELFIAEVYTEPKPLPKSGKSEAASKMTPEVSAPAKETPADELPQPDNANAEVIPDAAQMEHILELPKSDLSASLFGKKCWPFCK